MVDKCIEFGFDDLKYQKWISQVESWDQFVSQNVEKKNVIYQKLVKLRTADQSDPDDIESDKSGGDWCIQQTEG